MVITSLEEPEQYRSKSAGKSRKSDKIKVYIDGDYTFPLYQSDIRSLDLEEGMELSEEIIERLLESIIFPRAKQKAMDLLKFQDRTEHELRIKLKDQLYPQDIINRTIEYVLSYGYLDDARYASFYIKLRKERKSRKIINYELIKKGIDRDLLERIFIEEYQSNEEDPELTAIKKIVFKFTQNPKELNWEEKQKIIAKLCRKGFDLTIIKRVMDFDSFDFEA